MPIQHIVAGGSSTLEQGVLLLQHPGILAKHPHHHSSSFIITGTLFCCQSRSCVKIYSYHHVYKVHITLCKQWCTDTSDPRHFGSKTVRHYIFGTEMSYLFVSVPKCLGHFSTSAEVSQHFMKGPKCLGQIGGTFMCLYRFTTSCHICTIHRDLPTVSQDILYIRNHTRTFTFDSLTLLRPREQFWWWWCWWSSSSWSSSVSSKNSAEN